MTKSIALFQSLGTGQGLRSRSKRASLFAPILLLLSIPLSGRCDTLQISVSGEFGAGVTADQLAAPDETWAISFDVNSSPVAANVDALGFDAPFSDFSYLLNGSSVAVSPESIRFYTTAGGGLFTLFFGPETGFYNGQPIPEFTFSGNQVFSGTTSNPTILAGSYPVSDALYDDSLNYDDEGTSGTVAITPVTSGSPTPEPSTVALCFAALFSAILRLQWRKRRCA